MQSVLILKCVESYTVSVCVTQVVNLVEDQNMDLSERKVMEYKAPIGFKSSDFSIDHILNKAGNSMKKDDYHCHDIIEQNFQYRLNGHNDYMDEQYPHCGPILNWLQYTRYHPPRLPRPVKIGPVKRTPGRLPRVPFTPHQLSELEKAYTRTTYLSSEDANNLAIKLELTSTRVKIWFQNRRARERREKRERDLIASSSRSSSSPEYQHNLSPIHHT